MLLLASSTDTTGCWAHATPAAPPPGWVVKTSLVATPVTLKVLLVARVRVPLVAFTVYPLPVAARWQPANVATPETGVTGLVVQVSVVPVGLVPMASVTFVEYVVTVLPPASWTVTLGWI